MAVVQFVAVELISLSKYFEVFTGAFDAWTIRHENVAVECVSSIEALRGYSETICGLRAYHRLSRTFILQLLHRALHLLSAMGLGRMME